LSHEIIALTGMG